MLVIGRVVICKYGAWFFRISTVLPEINAQPGGIKHVLFSPYILYTPSGEGTIRTASYYT